MKRASVLLADDHQAVAEQIRALLETEFTVVGQVEDGISMVEAADILNPDVIVADICMPELDGIAATVAIKHRTPDARIVVLTVHNEPSLVERALEAGALGYVLKIVASEDLLPAVHAALRGERYLPATLARHHGSEHAR